VHGGSRPGHREPGSRWREKSSSSTCELMMRLRGALHIGRMQPICASDPLRTADPVLAALRGLRCTAQADRFVAW
jgi:hypothetical protein